MTERDDELRDLLVDNHVEKHDMEQTAVRTALEAEKSRLEDHRTSHERAHTAHEKLHELTDDTHRQQHESEQKAVAAAVTAMDRRLDEMNNFRDQLREQAQTFASKEGLDALDNQVERRYEELRTLIQTEREERRSNEGVKRGMNATTGSIIAAVTFIGAVLAIIVVVLNLLSR